MNALNVREKYVEDHLICEWMRCEEGCSKIERYA
jgi:hypothetical protein